MLDIFANMPIERDIPEVAALMNAVEKKFGHKLESRSDFTTLSYDIERKLHEHLAENTLRRIWGRLKGYKTVFVRTLDVLSRYVGFAHWDSFCGHFKTHLNLNQESARTHNNSIIKSEDLRPGDRICIGWPPDRHCIVEFQGGKIFKAIECRNSILQNGDSFECSIMIKNYPLFVDNLVHGGEICEKYAIGLNIGITVLEKLSPEYDTYKGIPEIDPF